MAREREVRSSARQPNRIFEFQGLWLGLESGAYGFYFINWYDATARRTKRKSTGTRDLEQAKKMLIEAAHATPPYDPQNPAAVDIVAAKRFYFQHHVNAKRGGKDRVRDQAGPKRAFDYLLAYLAGVGAAGKVADLTLARQDGFMRWCRDHHQLSNKTSVRT